MGEFDSIDLKRVQESNADPIVKETYKFLKRYKDAPERKKWLERRKSAWKCAIENEMWEDADVEAMKKTGQTPVTYNKLNKGIQGNAALVTSNKPEIKIYPTRNNDPYVAELLKWGLDFVWAKNEGNDVVYDQVEEKNLGGLGFISARLDDNKGVFGRIVFSEDDPTIYYFDPQARDRFLRDTHIIKAQLRTREYIRENYPELKDEDLSFGRDLMDADETDTGKLTDTVEGADNYAVDPDKSAPDAEPEGVQKREIWEIEAYWLKTEQEQWAIVSIEGEPDPQPIRLELEPGQKAEEVLRAWIAEQEEGGRKVTGDLWPRKMQNRYLRLMVGKAIIPQRDPDTKEDVKERKNPYGLDSDGDPVLPVIPLKAQRTLNAFPISQTWYSIDINKSLCKRHAQFLYAASKGLNAPVVRTAASRWTGPADKPGSELEIPNDTPTGLFPRRLSPGTVDLSGLAKLIEEDKLAIDDQFDLPEVMRGQVPKNLDTMSGRLGLALQDSAQVMNNPHLRALESAIILLAKVLLSIMFMSWPRWMWERLLDRQDADLWVPEEEQGRIEQLEQGSDEEKLEKQKIRERWEKAVEIITGEGVTLVDLDIRVSAGSSLPTNRMARFAEALEMFGKGLVGRKEALEHSNYPGAKEIAERLDRREMELAQAGVNMKRS